LKSEIRTTGCTSPNGGNCGDGVIDAGEQCDGSNMGGVTGCSEFDGFTGGNLACSSCQFDTSSCQGGSGAFCGDGMIGSGEQCDGTSWGVISGCQDFDSFTTGALSCAADCAFDTTSCSGGVGSYCGDSNVDAGEQCDSTAWGNVNGCSDFGFSGGILACTSSCDFDTTGCTSPNGGNCGDGVIDAGEQCDGVSWGDVFGCPEFGSFTGGALSCGPNCEFDTTGCIPNQNVGCGNGVVEVGEQCDGFEWGPINGCTDLGSFTGGILTCDSSCLFDTGTCIPSSGDFCGDGNINLGEQCDLTDWGFIFGCRDFGFLGGSLSCTSFCNFDTSLCQSDSNNCGDGIVDSGEECDGPNWGVINGCSNFNSFTGGPLSCAVDCQFNTNKCIGGQGGICGDQVVDAGEQCDGANLGAISDCIDLGFSGGNLHCGLDCLYSTAQCQSPDGGNCGDNIIDAGEQCDGQNWGVINGCVDFGFGAGVLSCDSECQFDTNACSFITGTGTCGDRFIGSGELCDGSNWGTVSGCSDFDAFTAGSLGCDTSCDFDTSACTGGMGSACGDGVLDAGESCDGTNLGGVNSCTDLGFADGAIGCDGSCALDTTGCIPFFGSNCGDGVIDAGEQCDSSSWGIVSSCADFDSFSAGGIFCDSSCEFDTSGCTGGQGSICGDGVIDAGEQCDGSNLGALTGCTALGFVSSSGALSCDSSCTLDTSQCVPLSGGNCGDGVIDGGEQCDGSNWGIISDCSDFGGFTGGSIECIDCQFDTSSCSGGLGSFCGDGIIGSGEQCDGASWGSIFDCLDFDSYSDGALSCGPDCQFDTSSLHS